MPRMHIRNAIEQHDFDLPRVFNSLQRKKYFDFSDTLKRMVAGLQDFTDPKLVLAELDEALFQQFENTNHHIAEGSNDLVSFDAKGRFRLKTPKKESQEAEP